MILTPDNIIQYFIAPIIMALITIGAQIKIQPIVQKRIKKEEELWIKKRDLYISTIEMVDKRFDSLSFGDNKPITDPPKNQERNKIYRELLLVSDNEEIPTRFYGFMDDSKQECNPVARAEFIALLRQDLGKSKLGIGHDKIPYFRDRHQSL